MLIIMFLIGSMFVFGFGYYLGHQIGGTAHIRTQLTSSSSEQLSTQR